MFQARVNDCIFLNIYDEQYLKRTKNRVLQNRLIKFVLIKTLSNSKLFFFNASSKTFYSSFFMLQFKNMLIRHSKFRTLVNVSKNITI